MQLKDKKPLNGTKEERQPGMTVMVLRARRTLKVLNTDTFPKSMNSVRYLKNADFPST